MDRVNDILRLADTFPLDRESCEEHIRHVETMLDYFPLAASQGEQTIYLLNVKRRAELARLQLAAGNLTPRQRTPEPTIVEPAAIVFGEELED